MRPASRVPGRCAGGASLLEFLVACAVVAVLAGILLQRLHMYRQQAEQASIQRVVSVLQAALAARATALGTQGRVAELHQLDGVNPMSLLASPPPNYLGEFDEDGAAGLPAGHWYFDRKRHLLVYMLNFSEKFPQGISDVRYFQVKFFGRNKHFTGSMTAPAHGSVALVQLDGLAPTTTER